MDTLEGEDVSESESITTHEMSIASQEGRFQEDVSASQAITTHEMSIASQEGRFQEDVSASQVRRVESSHPIQVLCTNLAHLTLLLSCRVWILLLWSLYPSVRYSY